MDDNNLQILLDGFLHLKDLKRLIIKNNIIGEKSISKLNQILVKNMPYNLRELKISNCTISP